MLWGGFAPPFDPTRVPGMTRILLVEDDAAIRRALRRSLEDHGDAVAVAPDGMTGLRLVLSEQFLLALPEGGSLRLTACVRKTREFLRQCIREGQAEGELRGDIDADALAVVVMGTIQMLALSKAPRRQRLIEAHAVHDALAALLDPPATRAKSKGRERSK